MDERRFGRIVKAVAPGLTDTPPSRTVAAVGQIEAAVAVAGQALRHPLSPDDAADTVASFASDAAEALTGQVFVIDCGATMR